MMPRTLVGGVDVAQDGLDSLDHGVNTPYTIMDGQSVIGLQGVDQFVRKLTLPADGLSIRQLLPSKPLLRLPECRAHPFLDMPNAILLLNYILLTIGLLLQDKIVGLTVPI